jgi:DNA-binding FadR family transcriptional regulator
VSALLPSAVSVRVPKTAELVASHVRRRIVLGQLEQGDALPSETQLMEEFDISRPTLREAFRILESEGLITIRRGARGGARVQQPSGDVAARYAGLVLQHRGATLADVLQARVIVEAPAARLLASRRDRVKISKRLQEHLDGLGLVEAGHFHEFNAFLIELTGNQTLMLLSAMLENISRVAALNYSRGHKAEDEAGLVQAAQRARQRLIGLIRAGDADGAETLWKIHLTQAGQVLSEHGRMTVVDLFG